MSDDKTIHFGHFVHQKRADLGKSLKEFGAMVGVGEKRMWSIEQMATPNVSETTYHGLAKAIGMGVEEFDKTWRETPVRRPRKHRAGTRPHANRLIRVPDSVYTKLQARAGARSVEQYLADLPEPGHLDIIQPIPEAPSASGEAGGRGKPPRRRRGPKGSNPVKA